MAIQFVVDNRESASQVIRVDSNRRLSKVLFHLLKRPLKDSEGRLINIDRRTGFDRRSFK